MTAAQTAETLPVVDEAVSAAPRRVEKAHGAFRTISEVAQELEVPQHVLRFWETRFSQIRPLKRGGGRRYYRPEDVQLLVTIRKLLYDQGYTIKGVQKLMREGALKQRPTPAQPAEAAPPVPVPAAPAVAPVAAGRDRLRALLAELEDMRDGLRRAVGA